MFGIRMHINPAIRKDDLGRFACPNERCEYLGARGKGNIAVNGWSGRRRRFRQLICHGCGKTFSENKGTPFYGIHTDRERIVQALKMVVERGSMRGAARAMGVDKDTICEWVRKASEHAEAFTEYMFHDLHMTVVELDELWTTVKKSRRTSTTTTRMGTLTR
jgi:transposase-like protein